MISDPYGHKSLQGLLPVIGNCPVQFLQLIRSKEIFFAIDISAENCFRAVFIHTVLFHNKYPCLFIFQLIKVILPIPWPVRIGQGLPFFDFLKKERRIVVPSLAFGKFSGVFIIKWSVIHGIISREDTEYWFIRIIFHQKVPVIELIAGEKIKQKKGKENDFSFVHTLNF